MAGSPLGPASFPLDLVWKQTHRVPSVIHGRRDFFLPGTKKGGPLPNTRRVPKQCRASRWHEKSGSLPNQEAGIRSDCCVLNAGLAGADAIRLHHACKFLCSKARKFSVLCL